MKQPKLQFIMCPRRSLGNMLLLYEASKNPENTVLMVGKTDRAEYYRDTYFNDGGVCPTIVTPLQGDIDGMTTGRLIVEDHLFFDHDRIKVINNFVRFSGCKDVILFSLSGNGGKYSFDLISYMRGFIERERSRDLSNTDAMRLDIYQFPELRDISFQERVFMDPIMDPECSLRLESWIYSYSHLYRNKDYNRFLEKRTQGLKDGEGDPEKTSIILSQWPFTLEEAFSLPPKKTNENNYA